MCWVRMGHFDRTLHEKVLLEVQDPHAKTIHATSFDLTGSSTCRTNETMATAHSVRHLCQNFPHKVFPCFGISQFSCSEVFQRHPRGIAIPSAAHNDVHRCRRLDKERRLHPTEEIERHHGSVAKKGLKNFTRSEPAYWQCRRRENAHEIPWVDMLLSRPFGPSSSWFQKPILAPWCCKHPASGK